jgi:acyl-CoA synthetase (AMP-forming)/AMP-acid ligase II
MTSTIRSVGGGGGEVALDTAIAELLTGAAARWPDDTALVFPGRRLTYRELLDAARARGAELRALGVAAGDRVGLLLPNCVEYVELLYGVALIGAISVPINVRFTSREMRHVISNAQLTALVTSTAPDEFTDFPGVLADTFADLAGAPDPFALALADAPDLRTIVSVDDIPAPGIVERSRVAARDVEQAPDEVAGPDELAMIVYTSGTTAHPKGCMLGQGAVARNGIAFAERFEMVREDRLWDPLPFFHMASIVPLLGCASVGATYVGMRHFVAPQAVELIAAERATIIYSLFPPITQGLIHEPSFAAARHDGMRLFCNVAPPDVQRAAQRALAPARLVNAYGITEGTGTVVYSAATDDDEQRAETCGIPFPGAYARVVDPETNEVLGPGERGELALSGYLVFQGYFRDPENTAKVMDDEGWFHTGDVCSMDPEGRVLYHGRDKDMLKVGGENVGALEVEEVLALHPAVKLAQVVGIPDARLSEVPAAFVELAPGAQATEEELIAHCRERIASFKVPRHVRFVEEWPMSATKVQKFRLRDRLVAELGL